MTQCPQCLFLAFLALFLNVSRVLSSMCHAPHTLFTFQVPTLVFTESKLKGSSFSLSPSPNLSLFINCTTWHGSTMNVWAEGLIISYSVWCWFCNQTDQSALQMSGLSVIWVKQREPSQCFCCDLLNTSNSGREYTFYRWLLLLLLLGVF